MYSSPEIIEFQNKIEEYLSNTLTLNYDSSKKKGKDIHDMVWGTTSYYPWEIAILDLPILQRLRSIHQTGLAFLVYPTATHTRFDHTLGVVAVVDKLIDNINKKSDSPRIGEEDRFTLRLAALLHDIGHGPFSHVSEHVFGKMPEFLILTKWINRKYHVTPAPHEILSFMIVSSKKFEIWFDFNIRVEKIKLVNIEKIAEYIIGYSKDPKKKYLSDIINSPIDADKLDYLARDAKFSGLTIGYDVNRYFKTIEINRRKTKNIVYNRLSLPLSGVNSLEQMIISKMMLYPSLYHHQKVRSAECMFRSLCENIIHDGKTKKDGKLKLNHPLDFLNYVDSDFINFSTSIDSDNFFKNNSTINIHQCLCKRNLMKRALIISKIFIKNMDNNQTKIRYKKLLNDCQENNLELRERIAEEVNIIIKNEDSGTEKISADEIILDSNQLSMKESLSTMVSAGSNINEPTDIEIGEIIPIKQWVEGYNAVKLRGHIFCPSNIQKQVNKAARKVLIGSPYNIVFEKTATEHCHIDYQILEEEKNPKDRQAIKKHSS